MVRLEALGKMKKINYLIANRTRDFPPRSIGPLLRYVAIGYRLLSNYLSKFIDLSPP
jgi:hypothetical protein